jgi:hypothetical protein
VDAVGDELVSAMNSLVSGKFAGKCTYLQRRAVANSPEKSECFLKQGLFLTGSLNGTDQGKVCRFSDGVASEIRGLAAYRTLGDLYGAMCAPRRSRTCFGQHQL